MSQRQYTNLAKLCRTKFSNGSHHFHWSNDTAWGTMAVTLSASSERYLSHPTEQYPTWQSSNTHTHTRTVELVGEENFFNGALHWLGSHIPQLWPATLQVKLSQCRWASLVRGWLWGARLIWRYPTLSKLQLSK